MTYQQFEALLIGKLLVRGEHPGAIDVSRKMAKELFPREYAASKSQKSRRVRLTTRQPGTVVWMDLNHKSKSIYLWYPNRAEWERVDLEE